MVDHNVVRFNVSVHDALAMTIVQPLEQLVDVVSNIDVVELGVEAPEVGIIDVLENQRRSLALQYGISALSSHMNFVCQRPVRLQTG